VLRCSNQTGMPTSPDIPTRPSSVRYVLRSPTLTSRAAVVFDPRCPSARSFTRARLSSLKLHHTITHVSSDPSPYFLPPPSCLPFFPLCPSFPAPFRLPQLTPFADLPVRPLLIQHTMSTVSAPDRLSPLERHVVVAVAAFVVHCASCLVDLRGVAAGLVLLGGGCVG
jgi:hypothetical protein